LKDEEVRPIAKSERLYQRIVEQALEGIVVFDRNGEIVEWNSAQEKITGIKKDDAIGKPVWELMHESIPSDMRTPQRKEDLRLVITDALKSGEANWLGDFQDMPFQRPDGSLGILRQAVFPISAETGTIFGAFTQDVTEENKMAKELEKSEAKYRLIFESAGDAAVIHDVQGHILEVNTRMCELLGYSKDEMLSLNLKDIDELQGDIETDPERLKIILETGFLNFETSVETKAGNSVALEITAIPIDYEGQKAVLSSCRDVTKLREAREELLQSRERLAEAQKLGQLGNFEQDLTTNKVTWSEEIYQITGLNPSEIELSQETLTEYIHPEDIDKVTANLAKMIQSGELSALGFRIIRADGEERYLDSVAKVYYDDAGDPERVFGTLRDSTKEWKMEQALRESEKMYRTIIETSPDGVALLGLRGEVLFANRKALELLGGESEEDFKGKAFTDFVAPYDRSRSVENLSAVGSSPGKVNEYTLVRLDGTTFPAEAVSSAILNADGEVTQYIGVIRDISERKEAQESLSRSERLFRGIFEQSPSAIELFDPDGNVIRINQATADLFGIPDRNAMKGFNLFRDPNTPGWVKERLKRGEGVRFELAFDFDVARAANQYATKKEGIIHIDVLHSPILADDGTIEGYLSQIQDITVAVETTESLEESEEWFRGIFEESPIPINVFDSEGMLVDANRASVEFAGVKNVEELRRFNLFDDPNISDDLKESIRRGYQVFSRSSIDFSLLSEVGAYPTKRIDVAHVEMAVSPLRDEASTKKGYMVQLVDLTDAVRAEEELKTSHQDLELYTSLLQHDLRNDLQVLLSQTETAMVKTIGEGTAAEYLESVEATTLRMTRLLDVFGRPILSEERDVFKIIETAAAQAEKAHTGFKIDIRFEEHDRALTVQGSRLLPMVFDNLFRNSAEHSGFDAKVEVTISSHAGIVEIDFADNGPGISEEIRSRLFQKGVSTKGGGYGLYLAQKVVEGYGGTIELLHSKAKKGATFRVKLPLSHFIPG
jgi:PAS domain S-box-containing protein